MNFNGSETFAANRQHTWDVLVDPTNVGRCASLPITRVDDTHFRSEVKVGSGLFSATIVIDIALGALDPERHSSLIVTGQGSGTTINATTTLDLRDGETAASTIVDWTCDLELGGMFAGPGTRIIGERAPDAIQQLVACLRGQIEA